MKILQHSDLHSRWLCVKASHKIKIMGEIPHFIIDVLKPSFALFRDGGIKNVHENLNSSNHSLHLFSDKNRTHSLTAPCCWLCLMNQPQSQEPKARLGSPSHLLTVQQLKKLAIDFPFYLTFIKRSAKVLRYSTSYLLPKLLTNIQNLYM